MLQVLIVWIFQAPDNGSCSAPSSLRPQHFHLSGNCKYYYVRYCMVAAIIFRFSATKLQLLLVWCNETATIMYAIAGQLQLL